MIIRSISVTLLPAYAHYKSYTQIFQAIYKTDSFISLPALLCIVFSFRSIWHCFTAYSHYMCCWQILQHTKKRRTPHFTYGARHFVYRSYTPLILLMLNFTDARYRYIHRCSANVTFAALMNSFASQKESCSHLNHFLTHQNSKCSGAEFYKCQMSSLYCAMVLSDEKKPAWLMFTSIFFAHAIRSS